MNEPEGGRGSEHLADLKRRLRQLDSALVAFSGGVDSSLLLYVAWQVLRPRLLAVTVDTPLIHRREIRQARQFCRRHQIPHLVLQADVLGLDGVRPNPPDRCYHCKRHLFLLLQELARERQLAAVIEGSHRDDAAEYRPGRRALQELAIRSPLAEAGFNKENIRQVSRRLGLPSWNAPPMACLASRVPYNTALDSRLLQRIEKAEDFLAAAGIGLARVRDFGDTARIELEPQAFPMLLAGEFRRRLITFFRDLGYRRILLDLEGYRSGKLDDDLGLLSPSP